MNTTLPVSTTHPPDTADRLVLHIPASDDLRRLSLTDRLSLRVGLWLLQRVERPRSQPRSAPLDDALFIERRQRSAVELQALLTYDLHRQLR